MPKGRDVRPTSDKVRGAIFNILIARGQPSIEGAHVADLFAGSGALGIEALSRGAASATFVEKDRRALESIERNLDAVRFRDRATVLARDAERLSAAAAGGPFDIVFVDPPYAQVRTSRTVAALASFLRPEGFAVLEHAASDALAAPEGLVVADQRRYGSTAVTFLVRGDNRA